MATAFAKDMGLLDAHIFGVSSPKIKITIVSKIICKVRIIFTESGDDLANSSARDTAMIEAATFITVFPTNTVTSNLLGCSSSCSRYLSISGLLSIINFKRFLSSENNETSEPEKNAEQNININSNISL